MKKVFSGLNVPAPATRIKFAIALVTIIAFSACTGKPSEPTSEKRWLASGSILLSRPAPEQAPMVTTLVGFLPIRAAHAGSWLSIDRDAGKLSVKNGEKTVTEISAEGLSSLIPGSYQVVHKQRNPLWYAPDSYFSARRLPLPAEGDRERFRRGALGKYVVFVNKDTPIHSAPLWSTEVGGIRINEDEISKLYYSLQVGDPIEVK